MLKYRMKWFIEIDDVKLPITFIEGLKFKHSFPESDTFKANKDIFMLFDYPHYVMVL